jgi:hypothetical protein
MRNWLALPALVIAVALSGCTAGFLNLDIESAAKGCGVPSENNSVIFTDVQPDDSASVSKVACVLYALDIPEVVVTRIDHTRPLDGMQTADWDNVHATWSYDAVNGLMLTLEPKTR